MNGTPIRVLFVVPDLRVGGAERHVTTLLPRMDPERFIPSVVCIGEEGDLFGELRDAGIEATALHLRKRQALRALRELVAISRRWRPDVIVVRGYNAETLGRIAAWICGVRHTVVWVHDMGDVERRGPVRARVEHALMRVTSSFFGVAEAQRRYFVDELGCPDDKIRIIHNGVDLAQFGCRADPSVRDEFGFEDDDFVIAIIAALRPEKDHDTLLHAARKVVDEYPHAKVLIVGDGPMRPALEATSSELGLTDDIHFAGSRSDVSRLLGAVDVFVLCSTTECFPISLLEAMAAGRPAVCTAVGGIPEMIEEAVTGYLVPASNSERLAAQLMSLLSDVNAAHRMGLAARRRVEADFSLDRSVKEAQRALEEVVNGCLVTS